jgi:hypothetical protein
LAKRTIVAAYVCLFIVGSLVGLFAAWSEPSQQAAIATSPEPSQRIPTSNALAKADRLFPTRPQFALVALDLRTLPTAFDKPGPYAGATGTIGSALRAPEKPKATLSRSGALLDESQIASIKDRLKLTAAQAEHWPAVEAALIDLMKQQAREPRRNGAPPRIDVGSAEVQRLVWAATPLLMLLSEDQKQEVRTLARVIGLESVAKQI